VANLATAPPSASYGPALSYRNVPLIDLPMDIPSMKQVLANGHAFMLGISVYQSFYNAQSSPTGDVPVPPAGDPALGGHELHCFGYADDLTYAGGGYIRRLNQWANFTPRNFLRLPYAYIGGTGPDGSPLALDNLCGTLAPTTVG